MKIARLLTVLLVGATMATSSYAGSGKDDSIPYNKSSKTDKVSQAQQLAKDPNVSVERIAEAIADAIKEGASPSDVLSRVLDARPTWSDEQVAFLYKTVVTTTPGLSGALAQDVKNFVAAGKPSSVSPDSSEGMKVLAVIGGAHVNVDSVIADVVMDSTGVVQVVPVAPLRDPQPADPHPVPPTPPVVSSSN